MEATMFKRQNIKSLHIISLNYSVVVGWLVRWLVVLMVLRRFTQSPNVHLTLISFNMIKRA